MQAAMTPAPLIPVAAGVTPAERYLKRLCDHTFLSLWSYPSVFRDQGKQRPNQQGKELCDLLVVFENHVIIFSDKACAFPDSDDVLRDWQRWFRKAVEQSAKQIWGAERWIRNYPSRLFLDRACGHPFPIPLPNPDRIQFHRIVVAHNSVTHCRRYFGSGSGTLMLNTGIVGREHYDEPFQIGRLDALKGYIHVLDDVTLEMLLRELDTVSDFTQYLDRKESFLQERPVTVAAGEEELLAVYLQKLDGEGNHNFVLPVEDSEEEFNFISFEEGFWDAFQRNPQRLARIEAAQVPVILHAPAARATLEHMAVMQKSVEHRRDRGRIAEQLAPVLHRPV